MTEPATEPATDTATDTAAVAHPDLRGLGQGLSTVLVVGTGLMGTSVALALTRSGVSVFLADRDPTAAARAADLAAGRAELPRDEPDLVVLAVPPVAFGPVLQAYSSLYLNSTYTDLLSVKAQPLLEAETSCSNPTRFVGGHPLAGRERSGAGAARADLFEGRPWVLTPGPGAEPESVRRCIEMVRRCGADLVLLPADRHDEAVALVSHAPQALASLMAARLADADAELVALAGQGLRDVTRIAASDPGLWTEILTSNAPAVLRVLDAVAHDLDALRRALAGDIPDASAVEQVLRRGNAGRARLPGKHGAPPATYTPVPVVVEDRPGELARLLVAAGAAGVNVEDVAIEHSPGQPVGLVELAVRPAAAEQLATALRGSGWTVHL